MNVLVDRALVGLGRGAQLDRLSLLAAGVGGWVRGMRRIADEVKPRGLAGVAAGKVDLAAAPAM